MRRGKINNKKSKKRSAVAAHAMSPSQSVEAQPTSFVRSSKKPAAAMLSLASMMLATTAMAQEALPTIDVQEVGGGGGGGYQATQSQLSRMTTPLRDTPQTVNVVTQQVMQDQAATSVQDALRNVPGITFTAGEGGVQGDQINIRGYTARNDIYRDGIRDPGWYARDAFSFDRVEVYKGPSSFVFGRGSTGGAINIVSKLPQIAISMSSRGRVPPRRAGERLSMSTKHLAISRCVCRRWATRPTSLVVTQLTSGATVLRHRFPIS